MDFATAVITPVVQFMLGSIKKHLSLVVSCPDHIRDMQAKVRELERSAHVMGTTLEENKTKNLVVPENSVLEWLAEVEKIKQREDSIPTGVECFNITRRYKAGKQSLDIVRKIDSLMKEKDEIRWSDEIKPLAIVSPPRPTRSSTVLDANQNQDVLQSRVSIFNDALNSLNPKTNETQMLALCGMGGVGKTTMMDQLEKAIKEKQIYDYVVKVVVGQKPDPIVLQRAVAEYTSGKDLSVQTKGARAELLRKKIEEMSGKGKNSVLIMLDDVWEWFDLKEIGLTCPFPNGTKLLLSSRDESVCTQMGVRHSSIFPVAVLDESEAKKLFWKTIQLGLDSSIEPDLIQIGEDIVRRCCGLPLAITNIAAALREKQEKDEWEDALSRLPKSDDFKIKEIFKFSYENLKTDDLKDIFLLCGLFPEDYNIAKEDILRCGWGLKFFSNVDSLAVARRRVNTCVNMLIRSNLLLKSDYEGHVKMHDLVRDFVLSNVSNVKQASIVSHNGNVSAALKEKESYERILVECGGMSEFSIDFNHPNLTLLMIIGRHWQVKFPEDFYTRMGKLEVVAYKNIYQPILPCFLTNLRALSIHSCSYVGEDIYFLGDLINLEVLDLAYCGIHMLPSQIGNLRKLKLLDVTGCKALCIDDGVFQNLEKLEELYIAYGQEGIRFTYSNLAELKNLSRKLSALEFEFFENEAQPKDFYLEQLERFKISIGCSLSIERYLEFKNTLQLVTKSSELVECKINELFCKTEVLQLEIYDLNNLEDISTHSPQHSFRNLKSLCVSGSVYLTCLFTFPMVKELRKLESLVIKSCPSLKEIWSYEMASSQEEAHNFPMLRKIVIEDCDNIVNIFPRNPMLLLNSLKELEVENCGSIEVLFNIGLCKLERLVIKSCPTLKEIWSCEIGSSEGEVVNFPLLRAIMVEDCNSIVNLFPTNPMRLLGCLEALEVENCSSIEVLFNIDLGKFEQLSSKSSLRSIQVRNLVKLGAIWRLKDVENNHTSLLINCFESVEYIGIFRCKKFRNIVTPTTNNFDMRAIKNITIEPSMGSREREIKQRYERISQEQVITTMPNEEISEVGVVMSIVASPSYETTLNFHNLRMVKFDDFQGVDVVFEIESPSNTDRSITTQQQQPLLLLPHLENLELKSMDRLSHVWKCNNWNEFFVLHKHQPESSSFRNLTIITLSRCKSIKYLFSPLMVKLLSNLNKVNVWACAGMEEVVSNRDDKVEEIMASTSVHTAISLDVLKLSSLNNLRHIGGGQYKFFSQVGIISWSLCQYSKNITIRNCDALSSVITCYAARRMDDLQVLKIANCKRMKEVFETKEINNDPIPRNITMHKFPNLKELEIRGCDCLENIFMFSTLESLKKLEKLTIESCKAIKVIMTEEHVEQTTTSSKEVLEFPHLKTIVLVDLPNLVCFFLGKNIDFHWPLLDHVEISECPQMTEFASGQSTAPRLEYIHTQFGKHNLECGLNFHPTPTSHLEPTSSVDGTSTQLEGRLLSFHNLIECDMYVLDHEKIFPSSELQKLQKLEIIRALGCSRAKEVFEVALEETNNESQTAITFPKLREVYLSHLYSLKYIWKSNRRRTLEFPNLTQLSLDQCSSLEHVFTCSMVGSVMQLQTLSVELCENMKVIVKEDEEDDDTKVSEIMFPHLKSIKLEHLSSLEGFSLGNEVFKFPSLDILVIKNCQKIKVFAHNYLVPSELTTIETDVGFVNVIGEDLNSLVVQCTDTSTNHTNSTIVYKVKKLKTALDLTECLDSLEIKKNNYFPQGSVIAPNLKLRVMVSEMTWSE